MKKYIGIITLFCSFASHAVNIKDIATIEGLSDKPLIGYGLVVGLEGSGDKAGSSPYALQSLNRMLTQLGISVPPDVKIDPKNVAAVSLTSVLPAQMRKGQFIDVTVSSIGDAKSLKGGTLLMSPLKGGNGQIYALAQGNIVANISDKNNQFLSVGRIPQGAQIQWNDTVDFSNSEVLLLQLNKPNFTTATRVVSAINKAMGARSARALNGGTIEVGLSMDSDQRVKTLSLLENLDVEYGEEAATVVINARTGSIVMNKDVTVGPCAISHAGLQINVGGKAQNAGMVDVPSGTSLQKIVAAINSLGAKPADIILIIQAMKTAGALNADVKVI